MMCWYMSKWLFQVPFPCIVSTFATFTYVSVCQAEPETLGYFPPQISLNPERWGKPHPLRASLAGKSTDRRVIRYAFNSMGAQQVSLMDFKL